MKANRRSFFQWLGLLGGASTVVTNMEAAPARYAAGIQGLKPMGSLVQGLKPKPEVRIVSIPADLPLDTVTYHMDSISARGAELGIEFIFIPEGFKVVPQSPVIHVHTAADSKDVVADSRKISEAVREALEGTHPLANTLRSQLGS